MPQTITKYVNSTLAGNDGHTGDDPVNQPWKTIQHGVDWFRDNKQPGDTGILNLVGGFQENVVMNGAKYSNIVIQTSNLGAYNPAILPQYCEARVPVGGSLSTGARLAGDVFQITGASGVTLRNLTIVLAERGVFARAADDLTLDNCCIHHHKQGQSGGGWSVSESDNFTVTQCYVWSNTANSGAGGEIVTTTNVTITGTIFWLNEAQIEGGALDLNRVDGAVIEGCTIGSPRNPNPIMIGGPNRAKDGGGVALFDSTDITFRTGPGPLSNPAPTLNTISSNQASNRGGGIFIKAEQEFCTVSLESENLVTKNNAQSDGGGIYIDGFEMQSHVPELSVKKSRLQGNKSGGGGGIRAVSALVAIEESHLHDNEAKGSGGGISIDGCDDGTNLSVTGNSTLFNNRAARSGGAIYMENCPGYLAQSSVSDNRATTSGGAIHCHVGDDSLAADDVRFAHNEAQGDGGAISSSLGLRLWDCKFIRNKAPTGGAVNQFREADIQGCEFEENAASKDGAAFALADADSKTIDSNKFAKNTATGEGGGLLLTNCDLSNLTVTGNTFDGNGGTSGGDILANSCIGADKATLIADNSFIAAAQVDVK